MNKAYIELRLLVMAFILQTANASYYFALASIHKIERQPCYILEIQIYDNNNTPEPDRKSTRLNSSHIPLSRMPSSA